MRTVILLVFFLLIFINTTTVSLQVIGTTVAVDPDQSFGSGGISYRILPPFPTTIFSIDTVNGTITAHSPLDRENTTQYILRIEVGIH